MYGLSIVHLQDQKLALHQLLGDSDNFGIGRAIKFLVEFISLDVLPGFIDILLVPGEVIQDDY